MLSGVVCLRVYAFYKSLGLFKSEYVDLISSDTVKVSRGEALLVRRYGQLDLSSVSFTLADDLVLRVCQVRLELDSRKEECFSIGECGFSQQCQSVLYNHISQDC